MKFNFAEDITMTLGELPKEYNKAIHGPYDPAVFYGKKDTPLGQVTKRINNSKGGFARDGTRTHNRQIRSLVPYPLGHPGFVAIFIGRCQY